MNAHEQEKIINSIKKFYEDHRKQILGALGVLDLVLGARYFYLKGYHKDWNKGFVTGENITNGIIGTILWNCDNDLFDRVNNLITKDNIKRALETMEDKK